MKIVEVITTINQKDKTEIAVVSRPLIIDTLTLLDQYGEKKNGMNPDYIRSHTLFYKCLSSILLHT